MELRVLTWNLFHGRDFPPDPALFTWRSRLLRVTERNATHVQVNRDLLPEFSRLLAQAEWDLALLQECPPRWIGELANACDATPHTSLTSRNALAPVRNAIARCNPDLIASNEGGSNTTLVRRAQIVERDELVLAPGPWPERRTLAFSRLRLDGGEVCAGNLHASGPPPSAERELLAAAAATTRWAGDDPLILGGDFNVRPQASTIFSELSAKYGFSGPSEPGAIDHLLARGLEVVEPPRAWPPRERELPEDGLRLRLSDHAPVEAIFST